MEMPGAADPPGGSAGARPSAPTPGADARLCGSSLSLSATSSQSNRRGAWRGCANSHLRTPAPSPRGSPCLCLPTPRPPAFSLARRVPVGKAAPPGSGRSVPSLLWDLRINVRLPFPHSPPRPHLRDAPCPSRERGDAAQNPFVFAKTLPFLSLLFYFPSFFFFSFFLFGHYSKQTLQLCRVPPERCVQVLSPGACD